ncbi:ferrochelatase [Polaribacter litorisediminis]|uniref:ferrochelatase n=1 Tax=Polaribacter litorisediminis TaxID=1908341 RepID=UPI001CBD5BF7|nr:ferrochelatase [Polaribacter litorisediminis]UAM98640.1 ferrochelatase [Polaribacter litorisediminis]
MKGVLLNNLGSPDSTELKDVKKYLDEFLMDGRVIDIDYWKRYILIKGIILNFRPKKSAKAYKKIWWDEGSPLVVISERFAEKVNHKTDIPVELAMRYGSMSMEKGIKNLADQGVTEIFLAPLYPHYAMSSYETVVVQAEEILAEKYPHIILDTLPPFYNKPEYIKAMSNNIAHHLKGFEYDHILFSYHGIPERHIRKSDPTKSHCKIDGSCCERNSVAHYTCYRHQCFETTKEIAKTLNLKEGTWSNSFQSRLLKDPWLKPYTDFELEKFPEMGKKKLAVITPAFVSDCLETLEEIAMEGEEDFMAAGGTHYKHIPCMNDNDDWVDVMVSWIDEWQGEKVING